MDNRRFVLLKAAPSLTRQQMVEHWRTVHATLIANLPVFWKYTSRYIQNYVVDQAPSFVGAFPFDGIVETWQRPRADTTRLFADEPVYHSLVRADERKAFDMTRTLALLTEVKEIVPGPEHGVKLLTFVRRRADLSHREFLDWWAGEHADEITQSAEFTSGLIRYQQCHCMPNMERGFSDDRPVHGFDGVAELRFESRHALEAAFASHDYIDRIAPAEELHQDAAMRVLVDEFEIHQPMATGG